MTRQGHFQDVRGEKVGGVGLLIGAMEQTTKLLTEESRGSKRKV